jgi:hypothetical protein
MVLGNHLAGIEYHGIPGASRDCEDAVKRRLQFGDHIKHARIVTCSNSHSLLLADEVGDVVAVKSGFASGYGGEGPRRFSYVLQLLLSHGADIDECEIDCGVLERLDKSALTKKDFARIKAARPIRPSRWSGYIMDRHYSSERDGTL